MPKPSTFRPDSLVGQQVIWDFATWQVSGWVPYFPLGDMHHYAIINKEAKVVRNTFDGSCKKMVKYAAKEMTEESFQYTGW